MTGTGSRPTRTAANVAPVSGGQYLGRYQLLAKLASGGMATVFLARIGGVGGFDRRVAIKVLHPHLSEDAQIRDMFLDEARLAARIRHPNVVPTLDISDTDGDGFFLVMEYIEGDHLGGLLTEAARQQERLPVPVVVRIVLDALAGLGAAHELADENGERQNLVHRDVSPHNVMVGADGISRLTDFGVAKAEKRLSSTRAGQFKGKLSYMSPEQASTGYADQRSDLFSMGILLWESLTGRRLFRAENNAATLNKILSEPVPSPSGLWADLEPFDEVLKKALARDADDRFASAEEFGAALEAVARSLGPIATPRIVAEEVSKRLGEKIAAQKARIQQSIETLGRADLSEPAIPLPRDGSASIRHPALSQELLSGQTPLTEPNQARSRLVWVLGAAIVLLLGVLGAVTGVLLSDEDPPPPVTAGTEPNLPARTTPVAEVEPAQPIQAVVPTVEDPPEVETETETEPVRAAIVRPRMRRDRVHMASAMEDAAEMEVAMDVQETRMDPPRMEPTMRVTMRPQIVNNPYLQ